MVLGPIEDVAKSPIYVEDGSINISTNQLETCRPYCANARGRHYRVITPDLRCESTHSYSNFISTFLVP